MWSAAVSRCTTISFRWNKHKKEQEGKAAALRHARRLLAAVYLITGERYCPAICYPPLRCDGYCAALRERYHEEVCGGFNYRRASQETLDPCLQQLLLAFSQDEYRHANAMLCLLSGVM